MTQDWRAYRPAIWLAMLGVAVGLLVNPFWLCAPFLGAAIGVALRVRSGLRRRSGSGGGGSAGSGSGSGGRGGGSSAKPRRR